MPVQAARKIDTKMTGTPTRARGIDVAVSRGAAGFYHTNRHVHPL